MGKKYARNGTFAALYFLRQVFANSAGLPSPLSIQKQSNYRHSAYLPVYRSVWPAREAKPRFGAAHGRAAHDYETRLLKYFAAFLPEHFAGFIMFSKCVCYSFEPHHVPNLHEQEARYTQRSSVSIESNQSQTLKAEKAHCTC